MWRQNMAANRTAGWGIWALAAAVALHAVVGARAQENPAAAPAAVPVAAPPMPIAAPPVAAPAVPLGAECKMVRLGTPREYEKILDDLRASGRGQIAVVSDGVICGWP